MVTEIWCTECGGTFYCEEYNKPLCPDCGEEHLLLGRLDFEPHIDLHEFLDRR